MSGVKNTYEYFSDSSSDGVMLTKIELLNLPECRLKMRQLSQNLLTMSANKAILRKSTAEYKGVNMTAKELFELPECRYNLSTVRRRIKRGLSGYNVIGVDDPEVYDTIDIDKAVREFLEPPRIIPEDDTIKVTITPPAPHTTSHYWIMKSVAERRLNDTVNFKEFTR